MREILFRGKRTDNGEWVEGDLVQLTHKGRYFIHETNKPFPIKDTNNDHCTDMIQVQKETIQQYTGLKDKNGKRIFEGDVVTVKSDDEESSVIVWDNDELEWGIDVENVQMKMGCFYSRDVEIIGNIHDNEVRK